MRFIDTILTGRCPFLNIGGVEPDGIIKAKIVEASTLADLPIITADGVSSFVYAQAKYGRTWQEITHAPEDHLLSLATDSLMSYRHLKPVGSNGPTIAAMQLMSALGLEDAWC